MFNVGDKVKVTHTNQQDKLDMIGKTLEITDLGSEPHQFYCGNALFQDFELSKVVRITGNDEKKIVKLEKKIKKEVDVKNYISTSGKDIILNKKVFVFLVIMYAVAIEGIISFLMGLK